MVKFLRLFFLGPPLIERNGRPVQFEARKGLALVANLSLAPAGRSRDELAAMLWPEHGQSRKRLRHAVWAAKKGVGEEHLIVERESIRLRQELAGALAWLVRLHNSQGEYGKAIKYGPRWVALDPLNKPARQELMRAYASAGNSAAAFGQYDGCLITRLADHDIAPLYLLTVFNQFKIHGLSIISKHSGTVRQTSGSTSI